jgi:glycosyltransferase involved in cell wall biosynthesis
MRIGQNPAKSLVTVAKPERITVCVLNFIPFLSGFYTEALDVLKINLDSIREDPGLPFDLMVFDNGSCKEVQDWLLTQKQNDKIQFLFLSEKNLGKGGAWNLIFGGSPGEIIVYSDSDVLFRPGWLKRSIEILEKFPNVGMVTARPFRTREHLLTNTIRWAKSESEVTIQEGQFIPWPTFLEFNLSLGVNEDIIRKTYENTRDIRITYKGVTAQVGASHWQFTTRKEVISKFLPFKMDRPMGQVLQLDELMNEAGFLRLMVPEPLAMNMSNKVPYENRIKNGRSVQRHKSFFRKILDSYVIKGFLMKTYNQIFNWYNT